MLTISSFVTNVFGALTFKRGHKAAPLTATQVAYHAAMSEADEQRVFLESIAGLPEAEKRERMARRAWYQQLAERQGIMAVEKAASDCFGVEPSSVGLR